jgi:formylglycine-generating enzyme required for sulfatase activity
MVPVKSETTTICVDIYEAGVGASCPISVPSSAQDTLTNAGIKDCVPVSKNAVLPWRFVPYRVAEQLCARAGKVLITPAVWQQAALGTLDVSTSCPMMGALQETGARPQCVSGSGVFDMVGNVWELVEGEVVDGNFNGMQLPASGYISGVNDAGLPTATVGSANQIYNADYFWSNASGTYAIMRGGFYGGGTDSGLYSTQAATAEDFAGAAVGFRCMKVL